MYDLFVLNMVDMTVSKLCINDSWVILGTQPLFSFLFCLSRTRNLDLFVVPSFGFNFLKMFALQLRVFFIYIPHGLLDYHLLRPTLPGVPYCKVDSKIPNTRPS